MVQNVMKPGAAEETQIVCFRLGDEEFGMDIGRVQEIVRLPEITSIPRSPRYVKGIANLRGNILPVIDTKIRFSMAEHTPTERTRVLVLDVGGAITGLIVDCVTEVIRVRPSQIELPPQISGEGVEGRFLDGVVKLDAGKRLILLVHPEQVIPEKNETRQASGKNAQRLGHARLPAQRNEKDAASEPQVVSFTMADEEYGLEIETVKEILHFSDISGIPNAPPAVLGLLTVRDSILPVLDLRSIFHLPPRHHEDKRILVLDMDGKNVGMVVDRVNEVLQIPHDSIEDAAHLAFGSGELKALARLGNGERLILLLHAKKLVNLDDISSLMEEQEPTEGKDAMEKEHRETAEAQLVTFMIGEVEYGIRITQIQEINRLTTVTPVPKSPSFVAGVTNLRGQIVPLVDLRVLFHEADSAIGERTRVIIVDMVSQRTGLIVDQVNEVLRIPVSNIEETPQIVLGDELREQSGFIDGVGKLDGKGRMVLILDVEKILSARERAALRSASASRQKKAEAGNVSGEETEERRPGAGQAAKKTGRATKSPSKTARKGKA